MRGSPHVRAVLHMAAVSSVSRNRCGTYRNPVLAEYYERKCAEKPCKVTRVAVMRKLANIIYAALRNRRPFELGTPQEHMRLLAAAYGLNMVLRLTSDAVSLNVVRFFAGAPNNFPLDFA